MGNLFSNILKEDVAGKTVNETTDKGLGETVACSPSEIASVLKDHVAPDITTKEVEMVRERGKESAIVSTKKYDGEYEVENTPNVIDFENVTVKFGDFTLFDKLNFSIPDFKGEGQFIAIMGSSGSGKSQMARLISGLKRPTEGVVKMYGKPYDEKTHVPMVFQQYSSFPWMTVLENVALPLKMKGVGKEEREAKAMEILKLVGLEGHEQKWAQYPVPQECPPGSPGRPYYRPSVQEFRALPAWQSAYPPLQYGHPGLGRKNRSHGAEGLRIPALPGLRGRHSPDGEEVSQ
jgi:ABC-type glutathione transport system ATPase component